MRGKFFKLKEGSFRLGKRKKFFTMRAVRHWLEQVAQRSSGCPLPGSVQGQVGRGFEQPVLVDDGPVHGRGLATRWSFRSLPTKTVVWFHDSMILRFCNSMILWFWQLWSRYCHTLQGRNHDLKTLTFPVWHSLDFPGKRLDIARSKYRANPWVRKSPSEPWYIPTSKINSLCSLKSWKWLCWKCLCVKSTAKEVSSSRGP